jgi:D-alanyl-lipoteichoic acid acyltransferase DltB (MBOAT superfamily)
MLFNSYEFIFAFLPATVLVYFLLMGRGLPRYAHGFLLLASLFFYGWWNPYYLPLIVGSVVFNFVVANGFDSASWGRRIGRGRLLAFGVVANLLLLGFFKYADFFIETFNWLFAAEVATLGLGLPLAISFFTFQQIAFLVDCWSGRAREHDPLEYSVFITFFPQLIAGPIVHHSELLPQLSSEKSHRFSSRNLTTGLFVFTIGLFKKVIIADTLSVWVGAGFDQAESLNFFAAWAASHAYTLQLYFDFSGYTDMAIGAALLFNIKLPLNFNSPYKSLDVQDFWRRWHITLGRFLRTHIYIPLGGNRVVETRIYFNLFATFLIGGLWHGAGWNFVLWGALHGAALGVHRWWSGRGYALPNPLAWLLTFEFYNFTLVFFRALSMDDAFKVLRGMAGLSGVMLPGEWASALGGLASSEIEFGAVFAPIAGSNETTNIILLTLLVARFAPNSMQLGEWFRPTFLWWAATFIVFYWTVSGLTRVSEFLYFNF